MASANDTDPETNYRLALALIRDNKVNGDSSSLAEAVPILKEAAASGHAKAQSELGALYLDGRGVVQDFVQASAWYQKAADQGDADAMLALGRMYRAGWGMEADLVNAYIWLNLASARGQAAAQQARQEILSQLSAEELNEAQLASRELDRVLP
ncbi:MAG: sel1 repeat family protein [Congregibacter sp.]|nr:sel1 repeat family protein [Congregibacter sp.]